LTKWQVTVLCPEHRKPVYLIIDALTADEAARKTLDKVVPCPWYPTHNFVVGFREGLKEIIAVEHYAWEPPTTVSASPIPPSPLYEPHIALETVYYIGLEDAEKQLRKLRWWER